MASNGAVLALVSVCVVFLAGCGGSPSPTLAPNPTGSFSNASLNGTYAFSASGTNSFGFLAIAGNLQADGNGHITAGVQDINSGNGVFTNVPISGSYSVSADGRGMATLASSVTTIDLAFVLISSQHGLLIRFETNSSASGSLDRQDALAFTAAALQGTFAFSLAGIDTGGGNMQTAGNFFNDGAGTITSGTQDVNDNGGIALNQSLTGVYSVSSSGRGVATLNTTLGTVNLAFYVVDASHLKMVATNTTPVLSGDAFRQQGTFSTASISGPYAFTVAGSSPGPFAAGGVFTADGNGNISGGTEDVNHNGSTAQNVAVSGTYSLAANGRGTLTLNSSSGAANFVIYPSTGGVQMLETDSSTVSSGTAFAQAGAPFSNGTVQGNYGFALTGVNAVGEFDQIAQFSANGTGGLTGAMDSNFVGALAQQFALNGSYSIAANGRGTATFRTSNGTQNFTIYTGDSSRVLVLGTDSNAVAVGSFEHQ